MNENTQKVFDRIKEKYPEKYDILSKVPDVDGYIDAFGINENKTDYNFNTMRLEKVPLEDQINKAAEMVLWIADNPIDYAYNRISKHARTITILKENPPQDKINALNDLIIYLYNNNYTPEQIQYKLNEGVEKGQEFRLHTVESKGNDYFSAALPIALSFIAPGLGSALGAALAPAASAAVQAAIGSAVIGGTMAEATGGDFLKGALTSAVGSGIGSATAPISEFVGSQALGQALTGGAMAELQGGDFIQGAIQGGLSGAINDAKLAAAEEYLKSIPPAYTYESDLPTLNVVPGDTVGIVEAPITVDTSFTPDYSLSPVAPIIPEMGAQGIQVPTISEVIDVVNQPVDYSLPISTTNVGLVIPTTPNIESMGGGQGITVPVTGGTLTEAGVIPETYVPVLGDETSFINQPAPDVSVNIPEIVEQPKDISGELAALDAAKALLPLAAGALTAGAVVNAIQEDQPTGFEIVPIPGDWRSPEYNMAFTPSAPIDFGTAELLRGTQWQNPQIQAPKQYSISDVVNALNYQSVPFVQQNYEIPQVQMTVPDILEQFNVTPTVGVNDIIGNLGGRPMSIADIISGIQSGQTYSI